MLNALWAWLRSGWRPWVVAAGFTMIAAAIIATLLLAGGASDQDPAASSATGASSTAPDETTAPEEPGGHNETTAPDETTAPEEDTTSSTNFTVSGTPVGSVDDPPGDPAGCAGGDPTQSPLDITDVQVILGSTLSVGVTVSQPAEQFFAAGSNWWSAYLRVDLKGTLPNGSPWAAAFLADQYQGTAMLGLVDPATGDVIPNGVSFVGNQIWFQHAFDPMPTITQVDLSTAAGETEQSPAACDQATVIGE